MFARPTTLSALLALLLALPACSDDGEEAPPVDTGGDGAVDTATDAPAPDGQSDAADGVEDGSDGEGGASDADAGSGDDDAAADGAGDGGDAVPETSGDDADAGGGGGGGELCPEIFVCLLESCADAEDPASCFDAELASCGGDADQAERDAAQAWSSCLVDNECPLEEGTTFYECMRTSCLSQTVSCYAPSFGDSQQCNQVRGCTDDCEDALNLHPDYKVFDRQDASCMRSCLTSASEEDNTIFWDLTFCEWRECHDAVTPEVCRQNADSNPSCGQKFQDCEGDTG